MKKSARVMILGIGIILAGILGMLFHAEPSSGYLYWYISNGLPIFASIAGPIILIVGCFIKDEK